MAAVGRAVVRANPRRCPFSASGRMQEARPEREQRGPACGGVSPLRTPVAFGLTGGGRAGSCGVVPVFGRVSRCQAGPRTRRGSRGGLSWHRQRRRYQISRWAGHRPNGCSPRRGIPGWLARTAEKLLERVLNLRVRVILLVLGRSCLLWLWLLVTGSMSSFASLPRLSGGGEGGR